MFNVDLKIVVDAIDMLGTSIGFAAAMVAVSVVLHGILTRNRKEG